MRLSELQNKTVKNNNFIPSTNLIKIIEISAVVQNYEFADMRLKGNFEIKGTYMQDNSGELKEFNSNVPFEIIFTNDIENITNLEQTSFEFFEIEGRGIEFEINLKIDYSVLLNDIDSINKEVDLKLQENLEVYQDDIPKDDNELNLKESILPTQESKTKIRIEF